MALEIRIKTLLMSLHFSPFCPECYILVKHVQEGKARFAHCGDIFFKLLLLILLFPLLLLKTLAH